MHNEQKPRLAKVHSQQLADDLERAGWTMKHRIVDAQGDPYEFVFEWTRDDEPPETGPSQASALGRHRRGQ